jgi:DNA-directed RNA polymerase subunit F
MFTKTEEKKTEEKAKISIEVSPLSQKVLENIDILSSILTPLENIVINILKESPKTTNEIRSVFIFNLSKHFNVTLTKEEIEKIKPYKETKISLFRSEYLVNIPKASIYLEKKLKEKGIKVPSFDKFDYILNSLARLGIVGKRYDPLKKGKRGFLWILNPDFLIALKEKG